MKKKCNAKLVERKEVDGDSTVNFTTKLFTLLNVYFKCTPVPIISVDK